MRTLEKAPVHEVYVRMKRGGVSRQPVSVYNTKKDETVSASSAPDGNILQHIEQLEQSKAQLEQRKHQVEEKRKEADARADRISVKTREGIQSAMDTLMKKWMDVVDTKDEVVQEDFKSGLDNTTSRSCASRTTSCARRSTTCTTRPSLASWARSTVSRSRRPQQHGQFLGEIREGPKWVSIAPTRVQHYIISYLPI